jgi:hypothetical protein
MSIERSLFDIGALTKRNTPEQDIFENENKELLASFPDMVDRAFKRMNTQIMPLIEPTSRDKNLPAVLISGFLRGYLIAEFPHYCAAATNQRFSLKTDALEWIYIKKLNDNRRPMNIKTSVNDMILNQLSVSEEDTGSNIFLGYTATKDMTQNLEVFALCIEGEVEHWFSDLKEFAKINHVQKHLSDKKETKLKDDTVRIKIKENTGI